MTEKQKELLDSVDETKRGFLKKILTAGAAIYVAPMIASFSLSESSGGNALWANGGNMVCHPLPIGGNMRGKVVKPTKGHLNHGDRFTPGEKGDPCVP